jgi:hypothetical protein
MKTIDQRFNDLEKLEIATGKQVGQSRINGAFADTLRDQHAWLVELENRVIRLERDNRKRD